MNEQGGKKKIRLPESDDELLMECDVTTFRSSGKGGQHVNKTESAVRLVHRSSGIVTISRKERSQYLNKKECLKNLRRKIELLNEEKALRIPTEVPHGAKKVRKEKKSRDAKKKELRKKPILSD